MAKKGYTPWNKGLIGGKFSLEHRKKLSDAKKGKTPKNILLFQKKGAEASKGRSPWNKGLKMPEMSERIRLRNLSHPIRYWLGKKNPYLSKENNSSWKGGITPQDRLQRMKFRETMQKAIFKRDNYTCQMCGSKKDLQVDHIQSWAEYIELRFNMDNCRTLCAKCHYQITFGRPMPENVVGWGHNLLKRGGELP